MNKRLFLLGGCALLLAGALAALWFLRSGTTEVAEGGEAAPPLCTQPGFSGGNSDRHLEAPYVILVSFDGFRWDYLDLYETPNFDRVAREGTRADRLIPVFPTKTFPTHYSLATGMYAENHGLVGNSFWAPDKEARYSIGDRETVMDGTFYGGEPIWVTAERQGMVAASYFFVGSEAAIGGVRPTYCHRFDGSVPIDDRVDGALAWLELPPEERPHVITLYFSDVDGAGHDHGPRSAEVDAAVTNVDAALGRLLDGVAQLPHGDQVHMVLVSDHGMMFTGGDSVDVLDMDLFPGVRLAESGPYANIFVDEGGPEREAQVRDSIAELIPRADVYLRGDVLRRLRYSENERVGDIVVVSAPGRQVATPARARRFRDFYNHGWDNLVPEMAGILVASGPRIPRGKRTGPVEAVHVYPLIAEILGLEPHDEVDGTLDSIADFLRN